jgi:hypothetical protein
MGRSGEKIKIYIDKKDPHGRIDTLDQWRTIFGDHWNNEAELQSLAHIEKIHLRAKGTVTVKIRGTGSQLYTTVRIKRRGKFYTFARDNRGRFAKRFRLLE